MNGRINPWRSLQRKLPFSILVLLIVVVSVFSLLAYRGVQTSRLELAGNRLRQVAREMADLTGKSVDVRVAYAQKIAGDARVVAAASGVDSAMGAVEALFDSLATSPRNASNFRLVRAEGLVGGNAGNAMEMSSEAGGRVDEAKAHVGPIRFHGDSVFSEIIAPVFDSDSNVIGRLIQSRLSTSATQVRDLLTELIGGGSSLLFGNASGDVWTDLVGSVSGPSIDLSKDTLAHRYVRADVGERYGVAAPVENAPWIILVEYPLATVLAPAKAFLTQIAVIAAILIAISAMGASLLSRRITDPLGEATRSAESLAAGDYGVRLNFERSDEIGLLANAFNVMAEKVEMAHHRLEDEVAERTRELHATLEELRATQGELVRSEKLAMLGQLSSGLGHELRNPLGVMNNAVYFLQAITDSADEKVKQYLGIIREQIGLSENIISALLDYAKAKEPTTGAVQIRTAVAEQVGRLGADEGIDIDVDVADDIYVEADAVQLGQVLFNLLMNGMQALPNGRGNITVRAQESAPDSVAITVSDSGRGMPADQLKKIFEPLFTTKARGIGLGLAVTGSIVTLHGGTIDVESVEGVGSTFTVNWPAAVAAGVQ